MTTYLLPLLIYTDAVTDHHDADTPNAPTIWYSRQENRQPPTKLVYD